MSANIFEYLSFLKKEFIYWDSKLTEAKTDEEFEVAKRNFDETLTSIRKLDNYIYSPTTLTEVFIEIYASDLDWQRVNDNVDITLISDKFIKSFRGIDPSNSFSIDYLIKRHNNILVEARLSDLK